LFDEVAELRYGPSYQSFTRAMRTRELRPRCQACAGAKQKSRDPAPQLPDRVTVAAGLAAASTAVLTWVENNGTPELPDLIERAFDTLTHPSEPRSP
jgi:hypothetical protein